MRLKISSLLIKSPINKNIKINMGHIWSDSFEVTHEINNDVDFLGRPDSEPNSELVWIVNK